MPEKITIAINGIAKKIAISNVMIFILSERRLLNLPI
jgi:hypothetical protein